MTSNGGSSHRYGQRRPKGAHARPTCAFRKTGCSTKRPRSLSRFVFEMPVSVVASRDTTRSDLGTAGRATVPVMIARRAPLAFGASFEAPCGVVEAPGFGMGDACRDDADQQNGLEHRTFSAIPRRQPGSSNAPERHCFHTTLNRLPPRSADGVGLGAADADAACTKKGRRIKNPV